MPVTSPYADYLGSPALFTSATNPSAAAWGARAVDQEVVSPFATKAGADAEAARQIAFYAGPLVLDTAEIRDARRDLMGRVVTLTGDRQGYTPAGTAVLVVGAEELEGSITRLTVARRL